MKTKLRSGNGPLTPVQITSATEIPKGWLTAPMLPWNPDRDHQCFLRNLAKRGWIESCKFGRTVYLNPQHATHIHTEWKASKQGRPVAMMQYTQENCYFQHDALRPYNGKAEEPVVINVEPEPEPEPEPVMKDLDPVHVLGARLDHLEEGLRTLLSEVRKIAEQTKPKIVEHTKPVHRW